MQMMEKQGIPRELNAPKLHELQIGLKNGQRKSLRASMSYHLTQMCSLKAMMWTKKKNPDHLLSAVLERNNTIAACAMEIIECDFVLA